MSTTAEKIEVMQAYERGEKIESSTPSGIWVPVGSPCWNWYAFDYRIAPKPLECWVVVSSGGNILEAHKDERYARAVSTNEAWRVVKMREVTDE